MHVIIYITFFLASVQMYLYEFRIFAFAARVNAWWFYDENLTPESGAPSTNSDIQILKTVAWTSL